MKLRELLQWLSKLLPKQKMQDLGDGNIQAGRVDGDLNHSLNSNNQTVYNIVVMSAASTTVEMAEQPTHQSVQTPKLAPAVGKPKTDATQSQRDLLRLMAQSPANETRAEAFMRREFATDRVKRLSTFECIRTIRYLEACMQRETSKGAATE